MPDEALQHADAIVVGEAEEVWPQVVDDARQGRLKSVYRPSRPWKLADSPLPRFELLDPAKYNRITVQTSRGCPWKCDFCASSILIAPRYQTKPVARVCRGDSPDQVDLVSSVYRIRRRQHVRSQRSLQGMMRGLIPSRSDFYGDRHQFWDDPELISLARDAGCRQVLIGFESPRRSVLTEWNYTPIGN